jgi:hypothetical protein
LEVGSWNLEVFVFVVILHASIAAAHHSFAAEYDVDAIGASHGG